jgi:hypothetical protein
MSLDQSANGRGSFRRLMASNAALGSLIAILSILTAFASYQSSLQGSKESDANVEGQAILADANAGYLAANQTIIYDYSMYDGFYIHDGEDEFRAAYYRASFSEELDAAMELDEENPFSDEYYESMFASADETYRQALQRFEDAQSAGKKSNDLQMVMLIMAVGLSLSAWASLLPDTSDMRVLFASFSVVALVVGLLAYVTAM